MEIPTSPHDPQLLRGVLPMLILSLLHHEESYGYDLVERLRSLGLSGLATGAVYPVLSRFERDGWLRSYTRPSASGPSRKYYALTEAGEEARLDAAQKWQEVVAVAEKGLSLVSEKTKHREERSLS